MLRLISLASALSLTLITLIGCAQPEVEAKQSEFQLLLTDAPADEASELRIDFGKIELVSFESEEGGIVTITEAGGSFDVLQLRNGKTELLAKTTIPDGSYSQLRLIIRHASITIDDEEQPIKIPSGAQSGLKINIEPPLRAQEGQTSTVTLDVNARRIIQTGNGSYKMSPTAIRAVSVSGTLQGRVIDSDGKPIMGAMVNVSDASGAVTEASSDAEGLFKIITLLEGNYTVGISHDDYVSQSFSGVAILADAETRLSEDGDIILLREEEVVGF